MNKLLHHKDDDIFSTSWYTVWQYNKRGLATMKHKYCKLPHLSKGKSFICCLKTYLLSNVLNSPVCTYSEVQEYLSNSSNSRHVRSWVRLNNSSSMLTAIQLF